MLASNYLLVYDNVDDVLLTTDIMPCGDRGAIITTSRDSIMSEDWTLNRHEVLESRSTRVVDSSVMHCETKLLPM